MVMASPGFEAGEQGRTDQQGCEPLAQLQFWQVRRKSLANDRPNGATADQRQDQR